MKKYYLVLFLILGFSLNSQKKNPKIEELLSNYRRNLGKDIDSSIYYINQIKIISQKNKDNFYLAKAYYGLGYCYYQKEEISKSETLILKAIPLAIKSGNTETLAIAYNQLGLINYEKGNDEDAVKLFLKSLDICEHQKLYKNKSWALTNLGNLFESQKDTLTAIKYYQENYRLSKEHNLKFELLGSCNNLALIERKRNPNQALNYFYTSLSIAKEIDDQYEQFNIHINLDEFFVKNEQYKNLPKAKFHLDEAKGLIAIIQDPELYFYYYYGLGGYYNAQNQLQKSIDAYLKALDISKQDQENSILFELKVSLNEDLYETYEKAGDYKRAFFYKKIYHKLNDSIFTLEKNKNLNVIIAKYKVDKKNAQIKLLHQQKDIQSKRNKLLMVSFLFVAFILISFLFFIYKKAQFQKKLRFQENINHQQEKIKMLQEQELKEMIALVDGQNSERNRIARDLHDGVAGDLAGIKLLLAKENMALNNKNIEKIQENLSQVFQEIRGISHNLSTNYTKDKTLKILISDLHSDYQKRNEFNFDIHIFPENAIDDLDETKKNHLYRIIQELLNNISKHAKANEVELSINRYDDDLNIILTDNGVGFNSNQNGIGLKNVHERLQAISAKSRVESIINQGTSIIIELKV